MAPGENEDNKRDLPDFFWYKDGNKEHKIVHLWWLSCLRRDVGSCKKIVGHCSQHRKLHRFPIDDSKLSFVHVKDGLHGNSKTALYSINHKLCADIQQMDMG